MAGNLMKGEIPLAEKKEPTIGEIRNTFVAMIDRLAKHTDKMPEEFVRKATLIQLKILALHSQDISNRDELLDFCLSAVTNMKYCIDAARLGGDGRPIKKALKRLRAEDHVNIGSIIFDKLQKLGT
jgi:hypothetical protein